MNVRIYVTGQNVWDRLYQVTERMFEKYAVPTKEQKEYAVTFLRCPPAASHLEACEWPEDVAA